MSFSLRNTVLRAVPGAFILNAGIGKLNLPEEAAESLQAMAVKGVPPLEKLTPAQFAKFISYGEITVGAALLTPFVPNRVAGAALAAFSGSLLSMYFNSPEMTEEDGIRPTQDGTPVAKDSWLAAIAAVLLLGGARDDD
ncbi:MAG: hypothetical protein Q4F53_01025 [Nesterenkonia sp.]|uniref:hypothetical protein n=1 Tax=Nesterenkonia marinintestina TaxID=2979865 RepID=UPI0021BEF640|nr:hypothetical protein [Nesterenkonia sp. GX14115]MDO5492180.1 hypothetical protein [Nesterenkonia sp.]